MRVVLWGALLASSSTAWAAPPVVAVFGLRDGTQALSEAERGQLTRYLAAQLAAGGRLLVVPEADLARALREKKAESYQECYDEACQIEIGRELAANKSVLTEVVKLGSQCALVATLYDLERSTTEQATTEKGGCDVDGLAKSIERAAARLRGEGGGSAAPPPADTTLAPPRPGVAISASHLQFLTRDPRYGFDVKVLAPDGRTHRCPGPVDQAGPCTLSSLAIGEARLLVSIPELGGYDGTFDVEPRNHNKTFLIKEVPSEGSVIAWSLGGVAAAAGVALFSVGVGTDAAGMVYAGIPSTIVGLGVLVLGFLFDGRIDVDETILEVR
ncbi:MAG: hypothetical protein IPG45_11850 [Deltaproteobacteria bacterium]|jgi:hypothetical protein|nr:hypothetical protein [Deltaproteobacteria bacterium]